jgi:hypothetical protein
MSYSTRAVVAGVCVDSGADMTYIVPCWEGSPLPNATMVKFGITFFDSKVASMRFLKLWGFFWLKQILDQGPEHRESKKTVLCLLIIIILIS